MYEKKSNDINRLRRKNYGYGFNEHHETSSELANLEITGEAAGGAVRVVCDGQGKFKSIAIKPEAINPENPSSVDSETVEMLEDVISSAMKEASDKASAEMQSRMTQLTGGIKIPGLFK